LFGKKKRQRIGDNIMTREEELKQLAVFIDSGRVTHLPPDERGPEMVYSAWGKPHKAKKAKKKAKKKQKKT
tara:strand:+ start:6647 stop:6859 length:213 start_codon:yes stop_codon:yes gene_type:complete